MNSIDSEQIQYSIHPPSAYLLAHQGRLLPDWSIAVSSMLLVLQKSQHPLFERTPQTELEKSRLRHLFLQVGLQLAAVLQESGYTTELFDPQTGLPVLSSGGSLRLDDVAIARNMLGYAALDHGNCSILLHPTWGSAVYPSTLVSSAPCYVLADVLNRVQQVCHEGKLPLARRTIHRRHPTKKQK